MYINKIIIQAQIFVPAHKNSEFMGYALDIHFVERKIVNISYPSV